MRKPTKQSKSWQVAEEISRYAQISTCIFTVRIRQLGVTHHKLCEYECNGCTRDKLPHESWDEYSKAREIQMQWVEKRKEKIEALITKYAEYSGLKVRFDGDPRGCTVRLFNSKDWKEIQPIWEKHLDSSSLGLGVDVW